MSPGAILAWLALPAAVLLAAFLPGRRIAGVAAIVACLFTIRSPELAAWPLALGWSALFAWLAAGLLRSPAVAAPPRPARTGRGFEAGAIALPLGVGLLVGLLAIVSRVGGEAFEARRATLGVLLVGAGVLHLMLRRNAQRAGLAFAALGLGLELLFASARAVDALGEGPPAGAPLVASVMGVALVQRIARARAEYAGSPFVSDAHQLQD